MAEETSKSLKTEPASLGYRRDLFRSVADAEGKLSKRKVHSFRQLYTLEKAEHDRTKRDLFKLFHMIETYESGLKRAMVSYSAGTNAGRRGVVEALKATVDFIQSFEWLTRQNLMAPLGTTMLALVDLENGKQSELFLPKSVSYRPKDRRTTQIIRIHAAIILECLMRCDFTQPEAAKMVASTLKKSRFPFGQTRGNPSNTIISWRDQVKKSNDANRDFYDREIERRILDDAPRSVVGQRLLGQLRDLVAAIAPRPK